MAPKPIARALVEATKDAKIKLAAQEKVAIHRIRSSTKLFYDEPLTAIFMAVNHGLRYEITLTALISVFAHVPGGRHLQFEEKYTPAAPGGKIYLHRVSKSMLVPRDGDVGLGTAGDAVFFRGEQWIRGTGAIHLYKIRPVIIKRAGVTFIEPKEEA